MTIHVECDDCFREYNVKDEFAGRKIRCKDCGNPILIPSQKKKSSRANGKNKKKAKQQTVEKHSSSWLIPAIAACILILGLGGGLFFYFSGSAERELYTSLTIMEQKATSFEEQEQYDQAIEKYQDINTQISNFESPSERLSNLKKKSQDSIKRCEESVVKETLLAQQAEELKLITPLANSVKESCKANDIEKAFTGYKTLLTKTDELENKSEAINDLINQTSETVQGLFEIWVKEQDELAGKFTSNSQFEQAALVYESINKSSKLLGEQASSLEIIKLIQNKQGLNSQYFKVQELIEEYSLEDAIELASGSADTDPKMKKLLTMAEKELALIKETEIKKEKESRILASFGKFSPASKEFAEKLDTLEKTPESLLELANWCKENDLLLEADECLRAVIAADPQNKEATNLYMEIAPAASNQTLSLLSPSPAIAPDLVDAKIRIVPPKDHYLVTIPVFIDFKQDKIKISEKTVKGITGGKTAKFMGIHHTPHKHRFLSSFLKKEKGWEKYSMSNKEELKYLENYKEQIWEELSNVKEDGTVAVELKNSKMPVPKGYSGVNKSDKGKKKKSKKKSTKKKKPSDNKTNYIKTTISFKETPASFYTFVFAVPTDETFIEFSYKDEEPVKMLQGATFESLKASVINEKPPLEDRITALKILLPRNSSSLKDNLPYHMEHGLKLYFSKKEKRKLVNTYALSEIDFNNLLRTNNSELLTSVRSVIRKFRRRNNLINPLFIINPKQKHVYSLTLYRKKSPKSSYKNPKGSRVSEVIVVTISRPRVEFKTLFRVDQPGNILYRLHTFDKSKEIKKVSYLEIPANIKKAGVYQWHFTVFKGGDIQLAEIWRGKKLLGFRIFNADPQTAEEITRRIRFVPPGNLDSTVTALIEHYSVNLEKLKKEKETLSPGPRQYKNKREYYSYERAWKIINPELIASFDEGMSDLQFIGMVYLKTVLPEGDEALISEVLSQLELLESDDSTVVSKAEVEVKAALKNKSVGLFAEIAKNGSDKLRNRMISKTLLKIAVTNAEGCKELIELARSTNVQFNKLARSSVNKLIASGIIKRERVGGKKEFRIINGKSKEIQFGGQPSFTYHGAIHPGIADF